MISRNQYFYLQNIYWIGQWKASKQNCKINSIVIKFPYECQYSEFIIYKPSRLYLEIYGRYLGYMGEFGGREEENVILLESQKKVYSNSIS